MAKIIPIKELKNTSKISDLCKEAQEPIFVTKNGYGDMVVMSVEIYEELIFKQKIYESLRRSELDIKEGRVGDAKEVLSSLREKYGL